MALCPDCGGITFEDVRHVCVYPGEQRHTVAMLKADLAESELQREAGDRRIAELEASTKQNYEQALHNLKRATAAEARIVERAEKAEKERNEAQAFYEGQAERAEDLQESLHKAKGEIARLREAVKAASACMVWYWENATDAYQAAPMAYEDLDAVLEGAEPEGSDEVGVEVEVLDEDEEIRKATLHDIVEAAIEETRADKARSEESTAVEKWNPKKPGGNLWRFSRACTRHDAAMHDQNIARQKRRKAVERLGE